jgi:2,4-dienoyl-CoA reductase-like NADH-dependent reductase (Old Yellow Enzyme family)
MMAQTSSQDGIFAPLQFRSLRVKNRIFRSSVSGRWDNYDGSGTQARINWENSFAAGGVGAIISSYTPISIEGRIAPNAATIHRDEHIPFWTKVGQTVHHYDCKYILQLSHAGRQRDIEGIENTEPGLLRPTKALSSTHRSEQINGFPCRRIDRAEIATIVRQFADAAWRAREAGLDGIELHSSHGYLINQFLSSGINAYPNEPGGYGGSLENRYRFLGEIVQAIRDRVGRDFHLQAKISAVDHNNVLPFEKAGNRLEESIQICQWLERDGVDAIHVSRGSTFPHPLLPAGPFPFRMLSYTYDTMLSSSGWRARLNYRLFRKNLLRPIFSLFWNGVQQRWTSPIQGDAIADADLAPQFREHMATAEFEARLQEFQGTVIEDARAIKEKIGIPVICTGGFQQASYIRGAIDQGYCDGVSLARPLVANRDLVNRYFAQGKDIPERPCTYCNQCLGSYLELPLGCYELPRYYHSSVAGADRDQRRAADKEAFEHMVQTAMTVFDPPPRPYCPPRIPPGPGAPPG